MCEQVQGPRLAWTDLVHLEQSRIHLVPVLHPRGNTKQLRRVLMERPMLHVVNSRNR